MTELFLSHAASDAPLAEFLEVELQAAISNLQVFCTTRVGQIGAGQRWFQTIEQHLRNADAFLILLTPNSVSRPWIGFETGAAWAGGKVLVPAIGAGLDRAAVPEPFRSLQLLSLEVESEAAQLFTELGGVLDQPARFVGHARQLGEIVNANALIHDDLVYIDYEGERYAWDGPLERLRDGRPAGFPPDLTDALRDAGLELVACALDELPTKYACGFSPIFKLGSREQKHMLLSSGKALLVKPSDVLS